MQRKELKQASSELKRAQNAVQANKLAKTSNNLTIFRDAKPTAEHLVIAEEIEKSFELAQVDAEKAFQVVETYGEKLMATQLRVDAILGR